mmetsp:Transcript_99120/g.276004  ORF Transcript_99120/g.276004 Transcript_99120/m.276004 type:complete len:211 (-) Transcript_99120:690-1322(-)
MRTFPEAMRQGRARRAESGPRPTAALRPSRAPPQRGGSTGRGAATGRNARRRCGMRRGTLRDDFWRPCCRARRCTLWCARQFRGGGRRQQRRLGGGGAGVRPLRKCGEGLGRRGGCRPHILRGRRGAARRLRCRRPAPRRPWRQRWRLSRGRAECEPAMDVRRQQTADHKPCIHVLECTAAAIRSNLLEPTDFGTYGIDALNVHAAEVTN